MRDLVAWIRAEEIARPLPGPVFASLAHYQFASIHPYFDGNGRTARLLTTLLLHRGGYGLRGIYSLEEYYARHLPDYYAALAVGNGHNYYFGRAEADCSQFVEYFCVGMADSVESVRRRAATSKPPRRAVESSRLRDLDSVQRRALSLFFKQRAIASSDLAGFLGIGRRSAALLAKKWVVAGFLAVADPSKKARRYELAERYEGIAAGEDRT
jgi:Fic family protein